MTQCISRAPAPAWIHTGALPALLLLAALAGPAPLACMMPPAAAPPPDNVRLTAERVRLPVLWVGDFPLVETYVDGQGPYRFVLDSGAAVSALSPEVSAALGGIAASGAGLDIKDSHGRTQETLGWRVVDLRLGDAQFDDVSAAVLDMRALSDALGEPLAGILGFPLFANVLLTVDYPRREVSVAFGALDPVEGRDILALADDPLPQVALRFGAQAERLYLIDSGSIETVAMERWPPGARFLAGPIPLAVGVSLLGSVRIDQVGRLATDVTFGRHVIEQPIVQSCVEGYRLGTGVLRNFAITFDAANRKVSLRRDQVDPIRMQPVIGTGVVFETRPGAWIVLAVVPDSPAERAGLQIGDRVLQIDNMAVDRLIGVTDWSWDSEFTFSIDRGGIINRFRIGVAPLIP